MGRLYLKTSPRFPSIEAGARERGKKTQCSFKFQKTEQL